MEFTKLKLRDGTELDVPMKVPADTSKGVGQVGYQIFLQDKTDGIKLHMEAVNRASKMFFKDVRSVFHPFGGLGMAAQCMERTLGRQLLHEFWERDLECVKALKELYPGSAVYTCHDSFRVLPNKEAGFFGKYDLVFLDPTAMTCKKEYLWEIYDVLSNDEVQNIWFVDSAISKIWLHLETYSKFFDARVESIGDYFREYDRLLQQIGYKIVDLCREGTVVYGVVQVAKKGEIETPPIIDLR
jgi:hypothetical protein